MTRKVLLAEDSVTMQQLVAMTLATTDVNITSVASGREALAKANEMRPDLILADMSMPDMDGFEMCEALKADPNTAAIPVVLLGGAAGVDQQRVDAVGAAGVITKPFESQSLIDQVRSLAQAADRAEVAVATPPVATPATPQPATPPPVAGELPQAPPKPAAQPAAPAPPAQPAQPAAQPPQPVAQPAQPEPPAPVAQPEPPAPVTQPEPPAPVAQPAPTPPQAPPPLSEPTTPQPISQPVPPATPQPVSPPPTMEPAAASPHAAPEPASPGPDNPSGEPTPTVDTSLPAADPMAAAPAPPSPEPAPQPMGDSPPPADPVFGGPDDTGWEPESDEASDSMWGATDGLWDDVDKAVAETQAPSDKEDTGSHGPALWGESDEAEPTAPTPPPPSASPEDMGVVHTAAELANLEAFGEPDTSPSGLELDETVPPPAATTAPVDMPTDPRMPQPELPEAPPAAGPAAGSNGRALDGIPPERLEAIVRDVARSILERIAWEVVPDLAEEIIKDEIDRLTK